MYYRFFDMSSGGSEKTDYETIIIEAESHEEACRIFEDKFETDPYNITCDCCGQDFSISEYVDLKLAREYSNPDRTAIYTN